MKEMFKRGMHTLLLIGMALMIPCYLFTVLNVGLSPWPLYTRNRLALVILAVIVTGVTGVAFRAVDKHQAFWMRHGCKALWVMAVLYLVIQIWMGHMLRFVPKTDAEQCWSAARLLVDTGTFGQNERSWIYFTRCKNNLGMVYVLAAIFKGFGLLGWTDRFMQAVSVCSVLFTMGLLASAYTVRRIGGMKAQMRLIIVTVMCLPFLYCTSELYTDAFSLAFPMMTIACALHIQEAKSWRGRLIWTVLFGVSTWMGAQIRFTAIIAGIACLIGLLFTLRICPLVGCSVVLAIVFAVGNAGINRETARHLDPEDVQNRVLPVWHFLAMGLPIHEDEGYGQYGDGGWYVFTTSFEDPTERDEALIREIIDRVYYLRYPNRMLNMMSRKNLSTFGDGTFRLNEIIEADDYEADNWVKQVMFGQGRLYPVYYHVCTAIFMAQMAMAVGACVQAIRRRETAGATLFITLLGAFLFLCIWETRGRYFFQFQGVLLCAVSLWNGCFPWNRRYTLPEEHRK